MRCKPVDSRHLAPYQPLVIADEKHLAEHFCDVIFMGADEAGEGGEVRGCVAGECEEGDMLLASALDVAAADDALAVGKQHHLEHGGRISCRASYIVAESRIEVSQVDLVVKQVVQSVFDGARGELSLQVNCKKAWAGIDVFVTCHIRLQNLFRFETMA
jgi:hypothetical protein